MKAVVRDVPGMAQPITSAQPAAWFDSAHAFMSSLAMEQSGVATRDRCRPSRRPGDVAVGDVVVPSNPSGETLMSPRHDMMPGSLPLASLIP
jgi:hypothetical protein